MDFSKTIIRRLAPAAAALVVFFVVSAAYFAPQFRGEVLPQHDVVQYEGMAKDISDMRAATGEDPQWTGGMFGGMPAFLINVAYPAQIVKRTVGQVVKLIDTPAAFLFFAMTAMWLMLLVFGVDPWVGIVPALAYGLSTYFLLIIGAGHITKMWALVYAPLMMGGAWMTLRGNMWAGGALTALTASLEIGANHPQITYYFLLAMSAFWISEGIAAFREKHLGDFWKRTAVLAAAGILAAGSNFSPLWYTASHSKETMRGGSELASTSETSQDGLTLDYATAWSYGRTESLNLLIPDFMGRESATTFSPDGEVAAVLNEYGLRGAAQQLPAYWGSQPYTGGPTYLGAATIFLAALGIALARGRNKWWIVAVSVLMLLLAWGRNLMWFTELAFDLLPGYNKFRTVSMALVVVQWAVPLLGALALMRLPAYWGSQPYTGGPTYLGAATIFLAALGIALARGRNKWWIVAVSVLMLLLAWGRNLMWFTELAFDLLPGYNKFRTVSMALVVVQWAVPLLGALALMRLWRGEIPRQRLLRALAWAAGVTGGLCLLLAVAGSAFFDFGRAESTGMMTEQFRQLFEANNMQDYLQRGMDAEMGIATGNAMAAERASMMQADAWRSLLMILLAAGGVALFALRRINKYVLTALLAAVMLLDLVPVDLRFISHDNFISARRNQVTATAADKAIMADKEPGFRVFNLTVSPFQDATTSYFHRSVGGYHGAKLARYQDLIDRYLSYRNDAVLDMLNTRYLIVPGDGGQPEAVLRPTANGAAWFVDTIAVAGSPQQEIDLLGETDLKRTAVIAEKDKPYTQGWTASPADTAAVRTIALTEYRPNYLKYEYTAPAESVAVFSEIFYPYGWTAYVDGAEAPCFRADYVLRAMRLPAGQHTVEWKFRAPGWTAAEAVTLVSSLVILLGAAAAIVYWIRQKRKENNPDE